MDFGKQIKEIRTMYKITQEDMAKELNVTRQAISNWEKNKNLPDIEIIINIAKTYSYSLDNLILGENNMNNIAKKLINDGSENKTIKMNLIGICIGAFLLLMGFSLIILKGMSVEYIDNYGILHENFFLLPMGFLFIFSGATTFLILGIRKIINIIVRKNRYE